MQIGIIGLNHKLAPLHLRDLIAKACLRLFGPGATHPDQSFVLLSTCNRTELYFHSEDLSETHNYLLQLLKKEVLDEFEQKLYSFFGENCFWHLCRVTAGLDSAIAAETEIQGQVRKSYDSARDTLSLPSELHFLFQNALKVGKRVRHRLLQGHRMPDLEHAIFQNGVQFFQNIENTRILFVGASEINRKVISFFQAKGLKNLILCNRSAPAGETLAEKLSMEWMNWEHLTSWSEFDWIILGTRSPHPILTKGSYVPTSSPTLLMDLAVPCNAASELGKLPNIHLLNIDQINQALEGRRQMMHRCLGQAELLTKKSANIQTERFQGKQQKAALFLSAS